jgi:hypothetical protein
MKLSKFTKEIEMTKIEDFWENATADDIAGIANTRKPIPARFRDEDDKDWLDCSLAGWKLSKHLPGARWIDADGAMWDYCQVYREQSWWTNKPDPGPGFRLLGKFPDEELKPGDELWLKCNKSWELSDNAHTSNPKQEERVWYRRRIEPVEPKPQHYILRVGDSVETPSGDRIKCVEPSVEQRHYALRSTDTVGTPSGQTITITAKGFEVTQ